MPASMASFVSSGSAIDWVLGFVAVEALLLVLHRRRTAAGMPVGTVLSLLLPGVCLLLALRGALVAAGPVWIAGCLLAALLAHLVDLARQWPGGG